APEPLLQDPRNPAPNPESAALVPACRLPPEEETVVPPAISAGEADVDQVYEFMERDPFRSYRASELCQEVLETFPGSRSYQPIHDSLIAKMRSDARFVWVGNERFRIAGSVPDEVQGLPEGLALAARGDRG